MSPAAGILTMDMLPNRACWAPVPCFARHPARCTQQRRCAPLCHSPPRSPRSAVPDSPALTQRDARSHDSLRAFPRRRSIDSGTRRLRWVVRPGGLDGLPLPRRRELWRRVLGRGHQLRPPIQQPRQQPVVRDKRVAGKPRRTRALPLMRAPCSQLPGRPERQRRLLPVYAAPRTPPSIDEMRARSPSRR